MTSRSLALGARIVRGTSIGSHVGIDVTRKIAGEGPVRLWPDEIAMSAQIKELVARRWGEYGL